MVSTLTRTTWWTMYSSSSGLLGSLVMPLRLSVLIWYWWRPAQSATDRNVCPTGCDFIGQSRRRCRKISLLAGSEQYELKRQLAPLPGFATLARDGILWAARCGTRGCRGMKGPGLAA